MEDEKGKPRKAKRDGIYLKERKTIKRYRDLRATEKSDEATAK